MKVENRVYPDAEQRAELIKPGPDGPIVMVNLLKFREHARYPDGRDPHLSGREAYHRYGSAFVELLLAGGGRVIFVGDVRFLTLGEVESLWDEVALAEYPSRAALLALTSAPGWHELAVHREAGLEGQLNIETTPSLLMQTLGQR
jgi:uncharacterized protein (DUF1330 family)